MRTAPAQADPPPTVSRRRYQRERTAREEAETLLEQKSRELFEANQSLLRQAESLERKVAERTADLEDARLAAEAASAAKTAFLASMSHEIRTPLHGMLGMAQALGDSDLTNAQRKMLGIVMDSGQLLVSVINDILDLSKIESGKAELEERPFDLAKALRSAESLYALKAQEKGLGFSVELDSGCQVVVLGDETRLRQVLNNLVSNAIKFTSKGHVSILGRSRPSPDSLHIEIEIDDTGAGMDPSQLDELFQPFTQADTSITRRFGGTGLGLPISAKLVRMMGGDIAVESALGQGTRFTVSLTLPTSIAAPQAQETQAENLADLQERLQVRAPHLLVAEDNATNRLVLKHRLDRLGLSADFVEDGANAVARWSAGGVDAILMDVHMPVMDGATATRRIRAAERSGNMPHTPIIAFSADAMRDQVNRYLDAGMDLHLPKPGDTAQLIRGLAQVLLSP